MIRPLSQADRVVAFKAATRSFERDYRDRFESGMTDAELADALCASLGIFGGIGGPGRMDLTFQGAGLKIWASWEVHNHVTTKPVFAGAATVAMAREVYRIADPSTRRLSLL